MEQNKIVETILEESAKLEDVLNNQLIKDFGKLHNIAPEHNILSLKQEVVARWGYFLEAKKKYALHIISKKGVPIDELDTKGLVTRRSDYPSITKEKISELLDLLVMSEEYNRKRIYDFLEETKKEIKRLCRNKDKGIARPITYTKGEEKYKKVPFHVLAMHLWNRCEYNYFVPGAKGYLYNIKGIDVRKAHDKAKNVARALTDKDKYIALPYEEDALPEYFIVDEEAMMNFAWNNREQELLSPITKNIYKRMDEDEGIIRF